MNCEHPDRGCGATISSMAKNMNCEHPGYHLLSRRPHWPLEKQQKWKQTRIFVLELPNAKHNDLNSCATDVTECDKMGPQHLGLRFTAYRLHKTHYRTHIRETTWIVSSQSTIFCHEGHIGRLRNNKNGNRPANLLLNCQLTNTMIQIFLTII